MVDHGGGPLCRIRAEDLRPSRAAEATRRSMAALDQTSSQMFAHFEARQEAARKVQNGPSATHRMNRHSQARAQHRHVHPPPRPVPQATRERQAVASYSSLKQAACGLTPTPPSPAHHSRARER